jgi:hypothetical protein
MVRVVRHLALAIPETVHSKLMYQYLSEFPKPAVLILMKPGTPNTRQANCDTRREIVLGFISSCQ